jgi:hypothetical protein
MVPGLSEPNRADGPGTTLPTGTLRQGLRLLILPCRRSRPRPR